MVSSPVVWEVITLIRLTRSASAVVVNLPGAVGVGGFVTYEFTIQLQDFFSNLLKIEARERSRRLAGMWRADLEDGIDSGILLHLASGGACDGYGARSQEGGTEGCDWELDHGAGTPFPRKGL